MCLSWKYITRGENVLSWELCTPLQCCSTQKNSGSLTAFFSPDFQLLMAQEILYILHMDVIYGILDLP